MLTRHIESMNYIIKQKLQITDLANIVLSPRKVLLTQEDPYLAALHTHYLKVHNFDVKHCPNLNFFRQSADTFDPSALILSIEKLDVKMAMKHLKNFKRDFPLAVIITIDFNADSSAMKDLLAAGVSSHVNRKHSRPQDIATIVKTLLK